MRSDIPKECVNLTGRAMSDCVRDHNPASMRAKPGTNAATTNSMRNDKSGGGPGANGSGTAGSSGTGGSAGGAAGASGSGTGGAAAGGTGGDSGNGGGGSGK
jgi:hypothetical protein